MTFVFQCWGKALSGFFYNNPVRQSFGRSHNFSPGVASGTSPTASFAAVEEDGEKVEKRPATAYPVPPVVIAVFVGIIADGFNLMHLRPPQRQRHGQGDDCKVSKMGISIWVSGLILCLHPAIERRRYFVCEKGWSLVSVCGKLMIGYVTYARVLCGRYVIACVDEDYSKSDLWYVHE